MATGCINLYLCLCTHTQNGGTALMAASFGGHLAVVNRLIDSGADLDARRKVSFVSEYV